MDSNFRTIMQNQEILLQKFKIFDDNNSLMELILENGNTIIHNKILKQDLIFVEFMFRWIPNSINLKNKK